MGDERHDDGDGDEEETVVVKPATDDTVPTPPADLGAQEAADDGPIDDLPPDAEGPPPKVDFATFVLSLAANAVMNMTGETDDGRIPGAKINLQAAAQHIDIVTMLELKTRGNLSKQESDLIQSVLYDLRMRYLDAARA